MNKVVLDNLYIVLANYEDVGWATDRVFFTREEASERIKDLLLNAQFDKNDVGMREVSCRDIQNYSFKDLCGKFWFDLAGADDESSSCSGCCGCR